MNGFLQRRQFVFGVATGIVFTGGCFIVYLSFKNETHIQTMNTPAFDAFEIEGENESSKLQVSGQLMKQLSNDDDEHKEVICLDNELKETLDILVDEEFLYGLSSHLRETCKTYCDSPSDAEESNTNESEIVNDIFNEHLGENADTTQIKRNILNKLQMQLEELEEDSMDEINTKYIQNKVNYDVQINDYIDTKLLGILKEVSVQ
eukprot:94716_1